MSPLLAAGQVLPVGSTQRPATSAQLAAASSLRAASSTHRIYWGAAIGTQFTGTEAPWSVTAIKDVQNQVGKGLSLINFSAPFANSSGQHYAFDSTAFNNVRNYGAIPFFSWGSSPYTDSQIASGQQDAYIRSWAQAAKNWGHPLFMRFDWEMNGSWFAWGVGHSGNTPSSYVAMWRHVHHIFHLVGATNVTWVWCPNIDPGHIFTPFQQVYPGRDYVNWTCIDGYNSDRPWRSFSLLFRSSYHTITTDIAPAKPMVIGETASTESGGSKPNWITRMLATIPVGYPRIRAFLWNDHIRVGPGGFTDWPINSSAASQSAFKAGIRVYTYTSNGFRSQHKSPIPPP